MYRFRSFGRNIFVCVTLIGVKSKYGSGWGTSPGLMNINDTPKKKKSLCKEHKLLSIYMVQIHKHLCKQHKLLVIYMVQIHKQAHKKFIPLSSPLPPLIFLAPREGGADPFLPKIFQLFRLFFFFDVISMKLLSLKGLAPSGVFPGKKGKPLRARKKNKKRRLEGNFFLPMFY